MKRPTPPRHLTEAFREEAFALFTHSGPDECTGYPLRLYNGGPACWLKQHDPLDRTCSGDLEAFHFIGRQRIRNILRHQLVTDVLTVGSIDSLDLDDLVELAEWDPRNGGPGCTGHHRRLDSHTTPDLTLSALVLPVSVRQFVLDWGFESEAERKFSEAGAAAWLQRREHAGSVA
ncbi:MAG TPA: hypothetical protein VN758_00680 [Solirubrobacterales bacterium]|nr:hypothetical protein [Solirubrobacterales bacterium]